MSLWKQSAAAGVFAVGTGVVGRCTNVEVRQCAVRGVVAVYGGSITLIGANKTTVHHNCTEHPSHYCGLEVYGSCSSTIQLVTPFDQRYRLH